MAHKKDILIDLNTWALGIFEKIVPVKGETDLVDVYYRPWGDRIITALKPRIIKSIPERAIVRDAPPQDIDGVPVGIVFITENSRGERYGIDRIIGRLTDSINQYREKLTDEQLKSRTAQHLASESEKSLDRQRKKENERRAQRSGFVWNQPGYRGPSSQPQDNQYSDYDRI